MTRVALVTGAATGMGRASAERLVSSGWQVYGASRSVEQVGPLPFTALTADVTKPDDLARVFSRIMNDHGRLDLVVNCAGFVLCGSVEDMTLDEARRQFETNYFGVAEVCRAAIPIMRAQRRGTLVNVASIAGQVPMAFQAHYSASKAALTALTRAMRFELLPFGIHTVVVEPGDFATGITASRQRAAASHVGPYASTFARTLEVIEADERKADGPAAVAELIARIAEMKRPPASVLIGPWHQRIAVRLRTIVPTRLFDWVISWLYRLQGAQPEA